MDQSEKKIYMKAWRLFHPEEVKVYRKKYSNKYRDEINKKAREKHVLNREVDNKKCKKHHALHRTDSKVYRFKHKEEIKVSAAVYYRDNRDLILEKGRLRRSKNRDRLNLRSRLAKHNRLLIEGAREKQREKSNIYYAENRECVRARDAFRKLLTVEDIQLVYERNIFVHSTLTCHCCHKHVKFGDDCLEHLIPIIRGGTHELDNMDVAHKWCNRIKGRRTLAECKLEEFTAYRSLPKGIKASFYD